jgi:fused signal recognition particle receptor
MKLNGLFKSSLSRKIKTIINAKKNKEDFFDELEEILILSDMSSELVSTILRGVELRSKMSYEKEDYINLLREELEDIFNASAEISGYDKKKLDNLDKEIILLIGINGSGKTTSAAKLAKYYKNKGKKVLLGAADTFRAAGSSQLSLWGEKLDISVIGGDKGADPGSVVYNSLTSFQNKNYDVLIIDTAGRVQTKDNLMKELEKLTKIIKKFYPEQPSQTLLVIDATMGQNTLDQARKFQEVSQLSGIILSKIDGTAKGGSILNILSEMRIPVCFAGVGEKADDLIEFDSKDFIDSLLE